MKYKIQIEPEVKIDIQDAITWYNSQQKGLGRKFYSEVKTTFKHLMTNPYFEIRYDNVRCFPLKKYPYIVYFTINDIDKILIIRSVFHTSRNPNITK